jgi:uncharacterized membrane protein YcaP (DUF421 family)
LKRSEAERRGEERRGEERRGEERRGEERRGEVNMELVLRAAVIYFFLLFIFAIAGKRQLAEVDPFRLVLLLIISESTQQALVADDRSVTGAATVIVVLVGLEMLMSYLKVRIPVLERMMTGGPLVLVDNGRVLRERMKRENVDDEDILSSARVNLGIGRMDQVKYAVLEDSGEISIIPRGGRG